MSTAKLLLLRIPSKVLTGRHITTKANLKPSAIYLYPRTTPNEATLETPSNLSNDQRVILDSAIRVDQAGEVAANAIYAGQLAVLGKDTRAGSLVQEMWEQEKQHLRVMNRLQRQHGVRPTALTKVAETAGFVVGLATALMGEKSAMACTEAVETVIGEHYNDQLREFATLPEDHPSIPLLKSVVREFRDDELEHLNTAIENDSQSAPAHALLSTVIGLGCKLAIVVCKTV